MAYSLGAVFSSNAQFEECVYSPNLSPSYEIITKVLEPTINRGDTLEIEVYFSGFGYTKINDTKLYVSYPLKVLDNTNPGEVIHTIVVGTEYNESSKRWQYIIKSDSQKIGNISTIIQLSNSYFLKDFVVCNENPADRSISPIHGELKPGGNPPLLLKLNTYEGSESGDNEIKIVLTYSDGKNTYTYPHIVKFHINSFSEEHNIWYSFLLAILAPIAIALASFIWNEVAKKIR